MPILKIDRLSVAQVENLIRKVQSYERGLHRKEERLVKRLTLDGAESASNAYGSSEITVDAIADGAEGRIIASGEKTKLAVMEFGAGDTVVVPEFENLPDYDIYPGSYSETHAQMYEQYGAWYFGGHWYHYVYPRRGMHEAEKTIQNNVAERASEVFKHD